MTCTHDYNPLNLTHITPPDDPNAIFVFGSNEAGIHGAGAAKVALERYGAAWGAGFGLRGRSFAIPTKDSHFRVLPLRVIANYANAFLAIASERNDLRFYVTQIGCGYSGYTPKDIAPMFTSVPANVILPPEFTQ